MVAASARYSVSVEDRDTVGCRLAFQEISDSPMKMQKLVVDFIMTAHEPQSASEKACTLLVKRMLLDKISLDQGCLLSNEVNDVQL